MLLSVQILSFASQEVLRVKKIHSSRMNKPTPVVRNPLKSAWKEEDSHNKTHDSLMQTSIADVENFQIAEKKRQKETFVIFQRKE